MVNFANPVVGWTAKVCIWSAPFRGVESSGIERGRVKRYVSSPSRYAVPTWT